MGRPAWMAGDTARGFAVATAAGLFLAFAGAFGTDEAPILIRLAYWIPLMIVGGVWGHFCAGRLVRRIDMDDRPWLLIAALSVMIALPLSVVVWAATGIAFHGGLPPLVALPGFVGPVLLVTVALAAINVFLGRRPVITHEAADHAPARFLQRLPPRLRGAEIHAVQAEDHYLRIHTDRGSDLILMRLSDALDEMKGMEGAQTHRSWWVARDAVLDVARGDGRATLTLKNGLQAPVSRRHARILREAGWY